MKNLFFTSVLLFPYLVLGQTTYSGKFGDYDHFWTFQIKPDSGVVFTRKMDNFGYEEYQGKISKIKENIFFVNAAMTYSQLTCKAFGNDVLYVTIDEDLAEKYPTIQIKYINHENTKFPIKSTERFTVPLNKKRIGLNKPFWISLGHIDPITKKEVKTEYILNDGYCVLFYTEDNINFELKITPDKLQKIGGGHLDDFILDKKD